jgi:hypothetical protein
MKVFELFSGTRSVSRAFEKRGHKTFAIDYDRQFPANAHCDVETLTAEQVIERFGRPDVIWASPDCTTYSVAALGKHWKKNKETGELEPQTPYAQKCDRANRHMIALIRELNPRLFFIENPRGGMRTMDFASGIPRYTVTYCQYGERFMKPTDIWTNCADPQLKPPCHNGDPCHEGAPRRSKSGLQKVNGKRDRARIPAAPCDHIVDICEREITDV